MTASLSELLEDKLLKQYFECLVCTFAEILYRSSLASYFQTCCYMTLYACGSQNRCEIVA